METGWDFDVYAKNYFSVIRFEDLSYRVDLMLPLSDEVETSFCCFSWKTRPLNIKAAIPFTGYIPGQNVRVTVNISNYCGFDVSRTAISLKKVFIFISQTPERRILTDSKTILKNVVEGARNGKETKILAIVEIPKFTLPSNDDSEVVKVSYLIQVKVDVVGFFRTPKVKLPIVIGTKPLKFENKIRF